MGSQKPPACRHETVDRLKNLQNNKEYFSIKQNAHITFEQKIFVNENILT